MAFQTGKIASKAPDADTSSEVATHVEEHTLLAKLYVPGEQYQDNNFKNAIVDAFIAKGANCDENERRWHPTSSTVDIPYQGTCAGSPVRRLMVETHVACGRREWMADEVEAHNKEFLRDLCMMFYAKQEGTKIEVRPNCSYHDHEGGKRCPE